MKHIFTFLFLYHVMFLSAQSSTLTFENQAFIYNHLLIDSTNINAALKKNGKNHLSYVNHVIDGKMIYMLLSNIEDFGTGFLVEKIDLNNGQRIWQTTFDLRNDTNHHSPNHIFINQDGQLEVLSFRRSEPLNTFIGWFRGTFSRHIISAESGAIVSHDFGDPALAGSAILINLFGGTKIRPLEKDSYQYYYLGSDQSTQTNGCSNIIVGNNGNEISRNTFDFNFQLDKLLYSSIYDNEIKVLEYYIKESTADFLTYLSIYDKNWNKIDDNEIVLNTQKPTSAYLVQDVNGELVIETYIESDMGKRAYKIFYYDDALNLLDEIVLKRSYQYNYVTTVLKNNKGRLAIRTIPVIKDGKARCLAQVYLSKGSDDVLLKEFYVVENRIWSPQYMKELDNGQILVFGYSSELADNNGNAKLGSTEGVIFNFNIASLGITASKDIASVVELNLYPNPASNTLFIDTKVHFDEIFIYSVNGKLMNIYESTNTIDISNLPQGMFILAAIDKSNNKEKRVKFVKY